MRAYDNAENNTIPVNQFLLLDEDVGGLQRGQDVDAAVAQEEGDQHGVSESLEQRGHHAKDL